ncbi:MAG: PIN domain-containing protein [Gammaproteobacteria bacterium]|nr:PIN domain-containing protein [Gammaproteobacteria bacterium]
MESRNIFVDASIFIGQNYNYQGAVFENLARLAESGQARVFVTDIAVREVRAHIAEDIAKANHATSKFRKDARILRNLDGAPFDSMFSEFDDEKAAAALNAQLDAFLEKIGATTLLTSGVSIEKVFDKYFDKSPPFGEGKKKSEFPDAFTVEALEVWCEAEKEKMYVASTDPDLASACEQSDSLFLLKKLSVFVSTVQYHDDVLTPVVQQKFVDHLELIQDAISQSFCEQDFWLDDQEGDVEGVHVTEIEAEEFLVLEASADHAVVDVPYNLKYLAEVSYDDMDSAIHDSEDDVWIALHTIRTTVPREQSGESIISVRHSVDDPAVFEIQEVKFETGSLSGFPITINEWDYR